MSSERGEAPAKMPAEQNPPKAGNKDAPKSGSAADPTSPPYPKEEPEVGNQLPEEQPPKGRGRNRGKSDEARENAPGQEGRFEGDPNEYPDPEDPVISP